MRKLKLFLDAKAANTPPRGISKASRVIFSVLTLLLLSIGQMWGAEGDTHDFSQSFSQLLNNDASISSINIAAQSYPIKEVIVSFRYNKTIENAVTMEVSVGGTSWGTQYSEGTDKSYTTRSFTHDAATGAIVISFTNNTGDGTGHGTFYVNNVQLVEGASGGTDPGDEPGGDEPGSGDEPGGGDSEEAGEGTILFGSGAGRTNVNSTSVNGNDSRGKSWTVTTVPGSSGQSFTPNAAYAQIGASSKPASSITFEMTLSEEMSVTDFSANFGGFSGTAGTVTLKVGTTTVATGSLSASTDVTVGGHLTNAQTGTTLTVTVTDISKGVKAYSISYTVAAKGGTDPSAPTITSIDILTPPTKDTYYSEETIDLAGIIVKATLSDNSEENPVDISKLSASAIAKAADKLKVEQPITVTYGGQSDTYNITLVPYTPAGAAALIPNKNDTKSSIYTEGIVTRKDPSDWNADYGNIIYWISEDGTTTDELEVYRGKGINAAKFSAFDDLKEGDKIIVYGNLKNFNNTKEYDQNSQLISHTARELSSLAISGDLTETSYNLNATELNYAGLTVNATYQTGYVCDVTADVEWSIEPATLSTAGDEIAVTITASYTENNVNRTASKNVIVSVSDKVLTSITIPDNYSANIYCGQEIPKPSVTAHFDDLSTSDVTEASTLSEVDILTPGVYNITVSYTYGDVTKTAEFELTLNAYSVADVQNVIPATGEISTAVEGVIRWIGYVNANGFAKYSISSTGSKDDSDTLLIYNSYAGKGINGYINFDNTDDIEVGDKVIVSGKFTTYNGTKETKTKESYISSLIKKSLSSLAISGSLTTTVYELNDDIDVDGLVVTGTYNTGYEQDVTAGVTWTSDPEHLSTAGESVSVHLTATIGTISDETDVTVKVTAPAQKYAITFDGNGADGGSAPADIEDKAEGDPVTLPANTYTYTGHNFTGWKVYDENQDEVTVTAGAFEMPASDVTIKAQWAEISAWAYVYTSNVEMSYAGTGSKDSVIISGNKYVAYKAGSGSNTGTIKVKLPYQTHTLHFHALAWNGKSSSISISGVSNASVTSFDLTADAGATGSTGKYTLDNNPVDQYFEVTFDAVDDEEGVELVFSKSNGDNRFIIYGVNQEGGVLPVLDHIVISGDLTTKSGYKTGDALDLEGLTVEAVYTLGGVDQTPVDITNESGLTLTYDPLVVDQTEVTITASYEDKSDNIVITLDEAVISGEPEILTDVASRSWTSVDQYTTPATKTVAVTLKNVAAATATLAGDDVFSIDKTDLVNGDVITISVINTETAGDFAATITISDNATENPAADKVVNLSLKVVEAELPETPVSTTSQWVAATDADLVDGAEVLITGVKDEVTYAMGGQNTNNRAAVEASVDGEGILTPGEGTMTFILEDQGDGTFALRTSNGKYLYAASSTSNHLKTRDAIGDDSNANWTLTATSAAANGTNTNETLRFNSTNSPKIFSCYSDETKQTAIAFYVPKQDTPVEPTSEDVRTGLEINRYYTICLAKNVTAATGATFWSLTNRNAAETEVYLEEVTLPLKAGKPYIFRATAETLNVTYGDETAANPIANGALRGTFEDLNADALAAKAAHVYILIQNTIAPAGGSNSLKANRAYIDYDALTPGYPAPGRRVVAMPMQGQTATGCENIQAGEAPVKMMIDGQLFILRGEKMYDTTGRLVK